LVAPIVNWADERGNALTRPLMEKAVDVHRDAALPKFVAKPFVSRAKSDAPAVNAKAPAFGKRKAVIYATCFVNYNNPDIGTAAQKILSHLGVELKIEYPGCCGMPKLEQGDIEDVAARAKKTSQFFASYIEQGYDVIALVPSCALMLKSEWPLILPKDEAVQKLSRATYDIAEYIVDIAKKEGLAEGLKPLDGGVSLHLACHARAQNVGPKAAELLRLIPQADLAVIERCSGHGGSWGVRKDFFEVGMKIGKPVARQAVKEAKAHLASECPLAGLHIAQGMEREARNAAGDKPEVKIPEPKHPVELFAQAYGLI
jgi:glycerol-3-phosphate dehydrogenase subunit C